jgi:hypothetical protein
MFVHHKLINIDPAAMVMMVTRLDEYTGTVLCDRYRANRFHLSNVLRDTADKMEHLPPCVRVN